jgi:hypothetical protein
MDNKDLAEWVDTRMCASCKQGYTCNDWECEQAGKIADMLKRMVPFKGTDTDGKEASGWLVPD